jgi:hypothetical protein
MLELDELCLQICRRPEKGVVEEFAPNRAYQALHEGMRKRGIRSRLDFHHVKDSKIGVPLMESVQRIMVRAEVFWQSRPADCSLEHPAQRHSIDDAIVDAKANDAPGELVHHH